MSKGGNSASTLIDKNVKPKPEEDSTSPTGKSSELSELKKVRGSIREQFTKTKNLALAKIKENGSRTFIKTLVDKAIALNEESENMTRKIATIIPADSIEADCSRQDTYNEDLEALQLALSTYLSLRKNDAPSEPKSEPESNNAPVTKTLANVPQSNESVIPEWCKRLESQLKSILKKDDPVTLGRATLSYRREAPDDWIDLYCQGLEGDSLTPEFGGHSSVRVELSSFDGSSLRWFEWIGLFKTLVHDTSKAPDEKLAILKRSLRGPCAHIVRGSGGGESAYKEALFRLKEYCGSRDVMRAAHLLAIDALQPGRSPLEFRWFAESIRTHLFDISRIDERPSPDLIDRICTKLRSSDRQAWNAVKPRNWNLDINHFGTWLCERAATYLDPFEIAREQMRVTSGKPIARSFAATTGESQERSKKKCLYCSEEHHVSRCPEFLRFNTYDRLRFITKNSACFNCLNKGHDSKSCRFPKSCKLPDCRRKHHAVLHPDQEEEAISNTAQAIAKRRVGLGVIKIFTKTAFGRKEKINVLIDEGSDTTLIREDLVKKLGLKGMEKPMILKGVGGASQRLASKEVSLNLQTVDGDYATVSARSLPEVSSQLSRINWKQLKTSYSHLADLPLSEAGGRIDLLLGSDHLYLLNPTETREGNAEEPCAVKTKLGWVVRGPIVEDGSAYIAHVNLAFGQVPDPADSDLALEFRRFCEAENEATTTSKPSLTKDEQRALDIVEKGARKLDIGYECPLTWKEGEPNFENNRIMAEKAAERIYQRFLKDPEYEKECIKSLDKTLNSGYARKLNPEEIGVSNDEYYLIPFGVYKKSAVEKKLRIVFNAAAKCKGKSLNDGLLAGPALQNSLPIILTHFREGAIAFTSDVEAMFSRIRMNERDCKYHRFVFKFTKAHTMDTYEMSRLSFGDKCSPFMAIYILRRSAEEHSKNEKVIAAISKNTYMDDWLESAENVPEAIKLALEVKEALKGGDFNLHGWCSNSKEFLESLAKEIQFEQQGTVTIGDNVLVDKMKVLGVVWRPREDVFSFDSSNMEEKPRTLRGITGRVATIFDPMGFACPITVKAKIQLRKVGLKGVRWDDLLPAEDLNWWCQFEKELAQLKFEVPRHIYPNEEDVISRELHTFNDASEEAYCSVVYMRAIYSDGSIVCNIIIAKTKLAPKKSVSIDKLELNAAALGSKLCANISVAFSRKIDRKLYWTDNSCVRNWIRSSSAMYKPYVAHRIGEIQTLTSQDEWRFTPGKLNPSDLATRSSLDNTVISEEWRRGPSFLYQTEDDWPQDLPWMMPKEEVRKIHEGNVHQTVLIEQLDWNQVNFDSKNLSSFTTLSDNLILMIKQCQMEVFEGEIARLKKRKAVSKTSPLLVLNPFLDENQLLRVGGRIDKVDVQYEKRHPVVLPKNHPFTLKIVQAFHEHLNHLGTDFVLSHIRQHYWPIRGREAVKKVGRSCMKCLEEKARPCSQLMGNVPKERLEPFKPAFTHTAVDFFGPINVSYSRGKSAKRYGVIFTCLTVRAVYLDVAKSLASVDFLLVFRRFQSIYGSPETLHSDNGTNFVGGERELKDELKNFKTQKEIEEFCNCKGTKWHFQPPSAPHFGGAHESLIKSTKLALYRILKTEAIGLRFPSEELLQTLLFEVASLLNARPLTYTSSDPKDHLPLTPNDLIGKSSRRFNPPQSQVALPNDRYRYLKHLSNMFWQEWQTRYLPSLVERNKWKIPRENLGVGDLVLIAEPNLPRGQWLSGTVKQVFPGEGGLVRVAKVETEKGEFERPITKLCILKLNRSN